MSIMLVSVTERTREIGYGWPLARRHRNRMEGRLAGVDQPKGVVLACGFAGLAGISFGLHPAHWAAGLDPIVALRFE